MSFVEVLVAIVLLGIGVIAVMAGLQASIVGSRVERDHARAQQWLQSASSLLLDTVAFAQCIPADNGDGDVFPNIGEPATNAVSITSGYQAALSADASIVPNGWQPDQITIPVEVTFAQPNGSYGPKCYAPDVARQRVKFEVRNPDGDIVEAMEVVKVP